MTKLRVPSLQHLARNWRPKPEAIQRQLVDLTVRPPIISYSPLFGAARDLLLFRQPEAQIVEGLRRATRQPALGDDFAAIVPLMARYFRDEAPDYVQEVDRRFYQVSRDLKVPFTPPILYGVGSQVRLPWLTFWRRDPIRGRALSLFVTIVDEIFEQDPDLESARLQFVNFCADRSKVRQLSVIDAQDVPRVSETEKRSMLDVYAEGFRLAQQELAARPDGPRQDKRDRQQPSGNQPDMFDR